MRINKILFGQSTKLTEEFCEIVGYFIGDGFTNVYSRSHYLIQFTGHLRDDADYYKTILIPRMFKIFGLKPQIEIEPENNAIRASFYSKQLFLLLTERFKIKSGKKAKSVLIPKEILETKMEYLLATIRGIFDSDGSIYFDKRKIYKRPYPIIEFHMSNPKLIRQIGDILCVNSMKPYIRDKGTRLYLYGSTEITRFIRKVGSNNQKHLEKLKFI